MATTQDGQEVIVNFAAAKGDYDEPVPQGDYVGRLSDFEYNPSSAASGQPTMKLTWQLGALNDRKISRYFSLQPKALWAIRQALVAHGASPEVMNSENANIIAVIQSVIGSEAMLSIGIQKDNPEYNEVTKTKALSSVK